MLAGIIGHKCTDDVMKKKEKYITSKYGKNKLRNTTAVWNLLMKWKDGSQQWTELKCTKD